MVMRSMVGRWGGKFGLGLELGKFIRFDTLYININVALNLRARSDTELRQ